MLSLFWRFVLLAGAQTVTVVNALFAKAAVGPQPDSLGRYPMSA
jgi:hypothetical protein